MSDPAFGDWAGLPALIGAGEAPEAARARWIAWFTRRRVTSIALATSAWVISFTK